MVNRRKASWAPPRLASPTTRPSRPEVRFHRKPRSDWPAASRSSHVILGTEQVTKLVQVAGAHRARARCLTRGRCERRSQDRSLSADVPNVANALANIAQRNRSAEPGDSTSSASRPSRSTLRTTRRRLMSGALIFLGTEIGRRSRRLNSDSMMRGCVPAARR